MIRAVYSIAVVLALLMPCFTYAAGPLNQDEAFLEAAQIVKKVRVEQRILDGIKTTLLEHIQDGQTVLPDSVQIRLSNDVGKLVLYAMKKFPETASRRHLNEYRRIIHEIYPFTCAEWRLSGLSRIESAQEQLNAILAPARGICEAYLKQSVPY